MNKIVLWVVGLLIVAGGWYLYSSNNGSTLASSENTETPAQQAVDADTRVPASTLPDNQNANPNTVNAPANAPATMNATVTRNDSGFFPSSVTIKKGGTVTFTSSVGAMWVASNPHPSHEGYSGTTKTQHCPDTAGTAFDQCSAGTSYSFTFQKVGTWGYHDHKNPSVSGVVNVVE